MDENGFEYSDEPALDPIHWEKRSDDFGDYDDLY